jgi:hypothetical protein
MPSNGHSTDPASVERQLAERGGAIVAHAASRVRAPDDLRERIAADRERLRPVRRRRTLAFAGGTVAAVAAVATTLALGVGGVDGPPSVLETARAASSASPTMPAPRPDTAQPVLLRASIDGVAFPQWRELGWHAVGAHRGKVSGRDAMTVFYEGRRGTRAAYTILGGEPIDVPQDAPRRTVNDVRLALMRADGRRIVAWERDGHSCVMSAPGTVDEQALLALAAWDAGGDVPF